MAYDWEHEVKQLDRMYTFLTIGRKRKKKILEKVGYVEIKIQKDRNKSKYTHYHKEYNKTMAAS